MAQLRTPLHEQGPVNAGERRLLDFLTVNLPDNYYVIPNLNLASMGANHLMKYWEYDCIVVAPHGIFHIENKDWAGNLVGDDWAWISCGQERPNPHRTAKRKTDILVSTLHNRHPDWQFGWIHTLVTLSHPSQSKFGLDPNSATYDRTFTLGKALLDFLRDPLLSGSSAGKITTIQSAITDELTGLSSSSQNNPRTHIFDYRIEEVLEETDDYTEFLCVKEPLASAHYRLREYPLDKSGLTSIQLQERTNRVKNAEMAQEKIGLSPYIVQTEYRMNDTTTNYYEIMRWQEENTLRSRLGRGTLKQSDKVNMVLDVAKALKAIHHENVIHRNVNPDNIYLYEDCKAALGGFGMAWFMEHTALGFTVMANGAASAYTAPELLAGDALKCSDIFSLGVVFYELVTGRLPFDSVTTFITLHGGVLADDMMPTRQAKELPTWFDEVVSHTIVEDIGKRWQSADELIAFIGQHTQSGAASTKPDNKPLYVKDLKAGMQVTPSLTLHETLGKGGFGKVFKVWHDLQKEYYAIKVFDRGTSVDNAINEFEALKALDHPNIVRFVWNDRTMPGGLFYTLMELLEGENLQKYTDGSMRLPNDEIYKMTDQILDALCYMQSKEPHIYHRDIKPSNIVWHRRQIFKLIDFNISTTVPEDKSFAGTEPYMAPDLIVSAKKIDWDDSADTFALGVTLYQLLVHAYPWPGGQMKPRIGIMPTDIRTYNDKLSDAMADFVMKAIITDRDKRFSTAAEMRDALHAIGHEGMLKKEQRQQQKPATNIVDYINSLYSQSHHGNSGTRSGSGDSRLDSLTYSETLLDKTLKSDIAALRYKLIIITGNAGDGKTAFLHHIEELDPGRMPLPTGNGSRFTIEGSPFESNYDGSQDEESTVNDDVLERFFKPFFDLDDYNKACEGRIIAINEGRLTDFLSTHEHLGPLRDNIDDYFYKEGHTELLPGLMVINLNLRSVTADSSTVPSLLFQQVKKLTAPSLWEQCSLCPARDKCFIRFNVGTFQDSSSGDEVARRLEWLVRTVSYKRELHITIRDLRSMLAWMLTRDYSCDEVKQLVEYITAENDWQYYWHYYYFNISAPTAWPSRQDGFFTLPTLESNDRLVRLLRETDVAMASLPAYDRDLYFATKKPANYLPFSERTADLLKDFNEHHHIRPVHEIDGSDKRSPETERLKCFVRHHYYEGAQGFDFHRRLPYRFVNDFHKELHEDDDNARQRTMQNLAEAISRSEGCRNSQLTDGYLILSNSNIGDPISKSYRRFPLDEFELFVDRTDHLTRYIEYEPGSLIFRHKKDTFISLTIGLDLYEMLQYIRDGFNPSVNDLRGRFIELQIFKNLLEARTYKEILVTKNGRKFTAIRLDENKKIIVSPLQNNE